MVYIMKKMDYSTSIINHDDSTRRNIMLYVKMIAEFLNISEDSAMEVMNYMSIGGFDFSESDDVSIQREARHAYNMIAE